MPKVRWRPDSVVPFVGVCWWSAGGQVIVSLWPLVVYFGDPGPHVLLWDLRLRVEKEVRDA